MPIAPTVSRDPALDAHVFWHKYRMEILVAILVVVAGAIGFGCYRLYTAHRETAAAEMLSNARKVDDFERVIAQYPGTPAGASAYLLLAEAQRAERKFAEANATLQAFLNKYPNHEMASTAAMAIAANLEAMGKIDEALAAYQQVVIKYPNTFNTPVALISQIPLYKAKKQDDAARRVCEEMLTRYRAPGNFGQQGGPADNRPQSIWVLEAMRELRTLKPPTPAATPPPPGPAASLPPGIARPPALPSAPPAPAVAPTSSAAKPK